MLADMYGTFCSPQLWLIMITVFLICYNYFVKESWKKLPPGPLTLPVVGSLPFLGLDIREPLRKMAAKYGDVFTIYLGFRRVVVLNGYDAIKEAFVKHGDVFSGRPDIYFINWITEGYGIISSEGQFWQEQRRYALHILRNFGFGRTLLEKRITEEINFFIKELAKHSDMPFHPQPLIQKSVANVITSIIFGKRRNYDDPVFIRYMDVMNNSFEILGNSGILTVFPFVRYLPGDLFGVKQLQKDVDYMNSEYKRAIEEHQLNIDCEQERSDFIYAYLRKMKAEKDNKESTFTERQLLAIIGDLFGAGTETTTTTLAWAILFMALHQDIQERLHREIIDIIGMTMPPKMEHRQLMPFTEACLLEVQRLGDIVPLGVPHALTADVHFMGYFIPKGTTVMSNLNSVHRDPNLWPDPEAFKPDRFLDENGKVVNREKMIPFSTGKRICLGESLAKMELFLYFSSMFQHFHFRPAPGYPLPDMRGHLTITNIPKPFHIIVEQLKLH